MSLNLSANPSFLNQKEINWLKQRKNPVTVGVTYIPNQVLPAENGYKGYFIDVFKLIEKSIGIKFKYVYFKTWSDLLNAAKNGKVDIVFAAQKTPKRLKYFYFTDTVLTQLNNILENINNAKFKSVEDLFGKKVAITKCSAIEEYVKLNYPQIKIVETANELQALKLLNEGKVDAAIAENVRAGYYIKRNSLNNIIPGPDLGYNYYLSIASTITQPQLNVILSKAVNHLSKEKLKALKLKWGYLKEKIFLLDKQTLTYILTAFLIIIPFSVYLYLINKKLKNEIKEKEEALKRIKMLRDSKLNQMSEIMNMIAHQWKQPLNNLSLLIQIITKKYKNGSLDENTFKYFQQNANKQIELMTQTITDFKELFQIEESPTEFDLSDTVQQAIAAFDPVFNDKTITVKFEKPPKSFKIKSYPSMLKQIILNILNNSKDAMIENGTENPQIVITLGESSKGIKITIKDNAGGIPIEIIDKIFEPYFSTKKNKNGTGLGLYMAKIIIEEQMNGTIDVSNTENGASFEICLKN